MGTGHAGGLWDVQIVLEPESDSKQVRSLQLEVWGGHWQVSPWLVSPWLVGNWAAEPRLIPDELRCTMALPL